MPVQNDGQPRRYATVRADDPAVCCTARHRLRQGADPIDVAAWVGVCVEDLYEVLDYTPRRAA